MPAMIFKGSRLLCHIKGARTFLDANNNKLDIKVPSEISKESLYTRIFTLCPYVAKYIMDKERDEKKKIEKINGEAKKIQNTSSK